MQIIPSTTVAECVTHHYSTAPIFKKFKIDFCCGGKISIQDACQKEKMDVERLILELNQSLQALHNGSEKENYELDSLIDHIVEKHHTYVRDRIPDIEPFLEKVVHVHGGRHPELLLVQEKFDEIKQELTDHMYKEENILFPQIKKLVSAIKNSSEYVIPPYGSIKNPIQMMEMEHESAGSGFKIIRENTHNLQPPSDACQTYRVVFALLDEFETDLHRHIHLENNILFPGAIAYESSIL